MPETNLNVTDPEVACLLQKEQKRQNNTLKLIASENYVSPAVMEATGSIFTNKYSEGYPGKRYYEGQQIVDQIENLAIFRAKKLFGVNQVNVQPYSGSPANLAIYFAFLKPEDTIMGMSLPMGGHLTHGWNVSITGKWCKTAQYGVDKTTGRVDLDQVRDMALKTRPKIIFCGGTAIPQTIDFAGFSAIAKETGALLVADIAHIAGLIAGQAHPSPVGFADIISTTTHKTLRGPRGAMLMSNTEEHAKKLDRAVFPGLQGGPHNNTTAAIAVACQEASLPEFKIYAANVVANAKHLAQKLLEKGFDLVSGGTDNHLLLIDLTSKNVAAKLAAKTLDQAGLETNYNTIPYDTKKPFDPSGIRLGTAAITTRGMGLPEMDLIANWLDQTITATKTGNQTTILQIKNEVTALCKKFPPPGIPKNIN